MAYYFLMSLADQVVHPLPPLHPKTNKQKEFLYINFLAYWKRHKNFKKCDNFLKTNSPDLKLCKTVQVVEVKNAFKRSHLAHVHG